MCANSARDQRQRAGDLKIHGISGRRHEKSQRIFISFADLNLDSIFLQQFNRKVNFVLISGTLDAQISFVAYFVCEELIDLTFNKIHLFT